MPPIFDPLQGLVHGKLQAHAIMQQMRRSAIEKQQAEMAAKDMLLRQSAAERDQQMQDIQAQQMLSGAGRPVTAGAVQERNPLPFTAPGMDAPAEFPLLRKPDASRLVKYKTAGGKELQYELLTPEEQQERALEQMRAKAGMEAQGAGMKKAAEMRAAAPFEAEKSERDAAARRELEGMRSNAQMSLAEVAAKLKAEQMAAQQQFQRDMESGRQKFQAGQNDLNRKTTLTAAQMRKSAGGGAGGVDAGDPLVQAVLANPAAFDNLTPTQKTRIIPALSAAGFDGFGKEMASGDVRKAGEMRAALQGLGELRSAMQGNAQYVGPISGWQAVNPYSDARKVRANIDLIRQRVGKALEGGVLRKEDEEKYKAILPTVNDTMDTAMHKIGMLEQTLQNDLTAFGAAQRGAGRRVPGAGGTAPADPLGIRQASDPLGVR